MLVRVKVDAGAKKESVREVGAHRFEIAVRQKPERNEANQRVIELIARQYAVPAEKIRLVKGRRHSSKTLLIGER